MEYLSSTFLDFLSCRTIYIILRNKSPKVTSSQTLRKAQKITSVFRVSGQGLGDHLKQLPFQVVLSGA